MSVQDETLNSSALGLHDTPVANTADDNIVFEPVSPAAHVWTDIKEGILKWPVAFMLAYQDIKLRYRRSILGPFWLTISMGITVYTMGYIYSHIFKASLANYFPYLTGGMLGWALLSAMVVELTDGFTISENLIKQIKLPYTLYIHRIVCRNIIIFFHNLAVLIPILIIYHNTAKVNLYTLLLIPCLFMVYVNAVCFGTILAMVGARYRDISQIIKSIVQVVFFVTPVMWRPEALTSKYPYIVELNPFASFLEIIRAPLLGTIPATHDIQYVAIMTIVGMLSSWYLLVKRRSRIVYWI